VLLDKEVNTKTRNNYLRVLRGFFNWCVQHNYLQANPFTPIKALTERKKTVKRFISDDELAAVKTYLTNKNDPFWLACQLCYLTIRPKEICRIRIQDVDLINQTIIIQREDAKDDEMRLVSVPDSVIQQIRLHIGNKPKQYFLIAHDFRPGAVASIPRYIHEKWYRLRKLLRIDERVKFYGFKNSGMRAMIKAGLTIDRLAVQTGHSTSDIADIYLLYAEEQGDPLIKHTFKGL
jgi:integrase/recombinase XerD